MREQHKSQGDLHVEQASTVEELREINERLLISALREQELAITLEAERARLEAILGSIGDAVLVVDKEGNPILTNAAYARMMSDPDAATQLAHAAKEIWPPENVPWRRAARGEIFTMEFKTISSKGTPRWWEANGRPIGQEAGTQGGVLVIRDVSARKRLESALRHKALHDSLTGLPNRALLHDRIEQALRSARRTGEPLALLLLDLNHFKEINDTFGHHAGDVLLRETAARLLLMLRAADTVARLGGDEFDMLLPGTDSAGAVEVAERLRAILSAPVMLEEQALHVTVSIGIALSSGRDMDTLTLLRQADIAMYEAKRTESGHAIYVPDLGKQAI